MTALLTFHPLGLYWICELAGSPDCGFSFQRLEKRGEMASRDTLSRSIKSIFPDNQALRICARLHNRQGMLFILSRVPNPTVNAHQMKTRALIGRKETEQ